MILLGPVQMSSVFRCSFEPVDGGLGVGYWAQFPVGFKKLSAIVGPHHLRISAPCRIALYTQYGQKKSIIVINV
jgi:hypothetical protein